MTATCELDLEARKRGLSSVFVPTGQTGIAIAGWGISVDAVVSDFLAGAAERLVVEGAEKGDLLWVEGQGAILHPIYSGVTVGLIHGSAPHLYVLCHEVGPDGRRGRPDGLADREPGGAGRPPRAHVAEAAAREGRRDRAQHLERLRGGGPRRPSPPRRRRPACRRTTRSVSGPGKLLDAVLKLAP